MTSDPHDETIGSVHHFGGAADEGADTAERDALSQQGSTSGAGAVGEDEPCSLQTKLEEAAQGGGRWRNVGEFVVIAVLAVSIYLNALKGEFVFDDLIAVMENKDVLPEADLDAVFSHDFWGQKMDDWQSHKSFRPLTILSFRLSYILAGRRWDEVFRILALPHFGLVLTDCSQGPPE